MKASDIRVGMRVVPASSTHPRGATMEQIFSTSAWEHYMSKGYLIVCEIDEGYEAHHYVSDTDDKVPVTVYCSKNGRKTAWGHTSHYSWLSFVPSDLEPVTENDKWFAKMKAGRHDS